MENDTMTGEEIVISGISGIFPASNNVKEFMDNLYDNVDMVESSESYWELNNPDVPKYVGRTKNMNEIDPQFFKIPPQLAHNLDGMAKKVMEHAYGAILDAGINPSTLEGSNLGVFMGSSYSDGVYMNAFNKAIASNYILLGYNKTMLANRISFWLDAKGPSFSIDAGCTSSTACLSIAYNSIKSGRCDVALVGGCSLCVHPLASANLKRAGYVSGDGKTKCFDENGDGYVRSEAINVILLQKSKNAKRVYAEIIDIKEHYSLSLNSKLLSSPNMTDILNLWKDFYNNNGVDPKAVEYIEAFGAGLAEADANELEAIAKFFGKDKKILMGCLKSNTGHAEGASGICAVTKLCLAYVTGVMPASLLSGNVMKRDNVEIVTKNTPFGGGYTAVNSFAFTGLNYHILLKGHYKSKNNSLYKTELPRLILASGRYESSLGKLFDVLKHSPINAEQIALFHQTYKQTISSHLGRGYIILDDNNEKNETKCLAESVSRYENVKTPVWFLFSGMGSQWAGMGAELMRISIFAASIERCHIILKSKNIDLKHIITTKDEKIFDNALHAFVGITAIQIALTDVLEEMGVVPNNIIGHSLGELASAYADKCLSVEQAILLAYHRGVVSTESKFIKGMMAAVKLGHKTVEAICPPEIEACCHNSSESTTISGPYDVMEEFIKDLTKRGIFARKVNTSNIAFHSKYIADAGKRLLRETKYLFDEVKMRSDKWKSTSHMPSQWDSDKAKYASAEYFTHNLVSHVYFEEAAKSIPVGAIVIEIAPHGLLQAVVKQSHAECVHVPLTRRLHINPVLFFLESIGKLYEHGVNPAIDNLYPKVEFPVSSNTPMLSNLITWEHTIEWPELKYNKPTIYRTANRDVSITIHDDEWSFLKDYVRHGVNVFPESGYFFLVWETFAMYSEKMYQNTPIQFEDVNFHKEVAIETETELKFRVEIQKFSGQFEVTYNDELIVSGKILSNTSDGPKIDFEIEKDSKSSQSIGKEMIYEELKRKGYDFRPEFQCINNIDKNNNKANVNMNGQWTTFLDSFIQLQLLNKNIAYDEYVIPKRIRNLVIEPTSQNRESYDVDIWNSLFVSTSCNIVKLDEVVFEIKEDLNPQLKQVDLEVQKLTILSQNVNVSHVGLIWNDMKSWNMNLKNICGSDFSGTNKKGEKIMGVVANDHLANKVFSDSNFLWTVPKYWTLEEAATVPLPYIYAYYCLHVRANISDNLKIMIVDGASAVGQAIISICLATGCDVYTIINDDEESKMMVKQFPKLQESKIFKSTDSYFIYDLAQVTNKELCDIVINCSASMDLRQNAMKCLYETGSFYDLSSIDMKANQPFGMHFLYQVKEYFSIQPFSIWRPENEHERKIIHDLIEDGIQTGVVIPIKRKVYTLKEIKEAVNTNVAQSNEVNKVISKVNETEDKLFKFHSHIERDEYYASDPVVFMSTQLKNAAFEIKHEYNPEDDYLIIIPGFDSNCHNFEKICERIKLRAITLHLAPDLEGSIEEIAQTLFKTLKRTLKLKSKFYLLGYSFGINIALELASLIEAEGITGLIYCLDNSPELLKYQIKKYLNFEDDQLKQNIKNHIEKLIQANNEADNKDHNPSKQYKEIISETLFKRLAMAREYEPKMTLKSDLVLIKGSNSVDQCSNDYGLSKYTTTKVQIHEIPKHHEVLKDCRIPSVINRYLDESVKENFKKANLCFTYYNN